MEALVKVMRSLITSTVVLALLTIPASAIGEEKSPKEWALERTKDAQTPVKGNGYSLEDEAYLKVRHEFIKEFGLNAAGRNLVIDGEMTKNGPRPATDEEIARSKEYMQRQLNPPVVEEEVVVEETAPTPVYSGGVSNSTVMCESGGDYHINTGNGYYGGYQFDSQTWDAYGDSRYEEAHLAPPAVQDQAAASVPYDAWPNC